MSFIAGLFLLIFLGSLVFVFPLWVYGKIRDTRNDVEHLKKQIASLERELRRRPVSPTPAAAATPVAPAPAAASVQSAPPARPAEESLAAFASSAHPSEAGPVSPPNTFEAPPVLAELPPAPPPVLATPPPLSVGAPPPILPPPPPLTHVSPPSRRPPEPAPLINLPGVDWERFMGVNLSAWLGGLALFLGAAFFLKYSFDHAWIPPELRAAFGFVFALGLVIGGLFIPRKRYAVTAQTLCASGIVCLYAVTFACHSYYHFRFFTALPTFALMALITTTAFLLAVRMDAKVVAVLGILGGFLTPILLSTGEDNPLGLFSYLALLNIGLIAVALHRRWHFLVPLGAGGTVVMQIGWAAHFLTDAKTLTAMVVCLFFDFLFLAAFSLARRLKQNSAALSFSVAGLVAVSFLFGAYFVEASSAGLRPGQLFTFIFLADLCLLVLAALDVTTEKLHLAGGLAVFALLALWTNERLSTALLPWALAFYLLFAALHSAFPLVLQRWRPDAPASRWGQLFAPLALLLVLASLVHSSAVSFVVWPAVLLIDVLAVVLAWLSASLIAVGAVLVLTLTAAAAWLFKVPVAVTEIPSLLIVVGGFSIFFFAAGIWLSRKLVGRLGSGAVGEGLFASAHDPRAPLPALSALLPFVLLVMVIARLPVTNPSSVFGLALLLSILTLGLAQMLALEWLPACALVGVTAVTYAWHFVHFTSAEASVALGWYLFFHAVFGFFPFLFRRQFSEQRGPWIAAALSGPFAFLLVYDLVRSAWPNQAMGLLPAAFTLPALASLIAVLRTDPVADPRRLGRLALFGGVALFFITLIFPIQFSRQWITLGWALEGAALLWLFHRVPHRGLPLAGVALLVTAFIRLALNPEVLAYQARGDTPIFNWYLYSYGLVIGCLFVGAWLLAPPRDRVLELPMPPFLNGLAVVLLFMLLNIEIADYFSGRGDRLEFLFKGNFGRDMTTTIAWALFALGLLIAGIRRTSRAARYTALALLGVVLVKLFFSDLANLGELYLVFAFFGVAVIAIVFSVLYQRFSPKDEKPSEPKV